jgi:capsular exopolysaccharide synthesis family protein
MESVIEGPANEARLSDLVQAFRSMLHRRWKTLLLTVLGVFGVAAALIMLMTPSYEATARIRIDPSRSPLSTATEEQASLGSEAIETEVSVLSSPELAREVVRRLNLQNDPEFARGISDSNDGLAISPDERLNRVVQNVMRHLDVSRDKLTYIIGIDFKSRDASKAAYIANSFARIYIETRVNGRIGTAARQTEFYEKQLKVAAHDLDIAQQRSAQFHAQSGIVENGTSGTITDQQIAPLSTQLATAEAQAAEARSNLEAARHQIAAGGLDSVSAVRSSTVIADLRRQRAEVERDQGEIEARYGPKYPASIKVHDQLNALDAQIKAEANRAIGSLQAESAAADAQVASLRASLGSLKGQQATETRASATAASLDQDVANKKAAYDRLAQGAAESSQSQRNSIAQAELVDIAHTPTQPAKPHKSLLLALALLVSCAVGMALIIVLEMLSSGLRRIDEVESRLGLAVLASIPLVKSRRGDRNPAALLLDEQTSMYAEAFRNARSSIVGVKSKDTHKIIAITSTLPDEGKSTTALSLARISALAGSRTLLIECDVRRARLAQTANVQVSAGLVETLHGSIRAVQAIVHDKVPALDMLLVSKPYFSPEDLFGDGRMSDLLASLSQQYSLIVLDLPPVMGLADARTISALADSVVLAIRWGATPAPAVEQALSSLSNDGANVAGAILTMVDPRSEAIGGMFYSKKYARYYAQAA